VVTFDETDGSTVTVLTSGHLTVKSPPHRAGTVTVGVVTPGGRSARKHYTY
jgi:hypothetical protein